MITKRKINNCDILIVLNSLVAEGCPQLALNLADYWSSKKKKIDIICFDKYPLELLKEFEEINIDVHFYKDFKNKFFRYSFLILALSMLASNLGLVPTNKIKSELSIFLIEELKI